MHANTSLETPRFREESLVIVTFRSKSTLELLGIHEDACLEMLELGEADGAKLFLYHATSGKEFVGKKSRLDILKCIQCCYFQER